MVVDPASVWRLRGASAETGVGQLPPSCNSSSPAPASTSTNNYNESPPCLLQIINVDPKYNFPKAKQPVNRGCFWQNSFQPCRILQITFDWYKWKFTIRYRNWSLWWYFLFDLIMTINCYWQNNCWWILLIIVEGGGVNVSAALIVVLTRERADQQTLSYNCS